MDFLFPKFKNATHLIKKQNPKNTDSYPNNGITGNVYNLDVATTVCIMEEHVGKNFNLSRVKIIDENYADRAFYEKEIYVYDSDLEQINSDKKSFTAFKSNRNVIKPNPVETTYQDKVASIPFIDETIGMLCVKVMTEYEKAVDLVFFDNLVKQVAKEGARILLDSRGLQSDDDTLDNFFSNYNTFAYVLNTSNLSNLRFCSNLDFIVGIPLRFLNNIPESNQVDIINPDLAVNKLKINARSLVDKTDKILAAFSSKSAELSNFLFPDQTTPGFILNSDLLSIKEFTSSLRDLLQFYEKPLNINNVFDVELGYDRDYNLVYVNVLDTAQNDYIPNAILNIFKFRASFTSKRVINYFLNADQLYIDSDALSLVDFLKKYVKYPNIEFAKVQFKLPSGETLDNKTVETFKSAFSGEAERCVSATSALNQVVFSNPVYHIFWTQVNKDNAPREKTLNEKILELEKGLEEEKQKKQLEDLKNISFLDSMFNFSGSIEFTSTIQNASIEQLKKEFNYSSKKNVYGNIFNSIVAVGKRLNIEDLMIRKLVCLIKQGDPQDKELSELILKLGPDLWNYIVYVSQLEGDPATKLRNAISNLSTFDEIAAYNFCSSNKFLIVFLKALKVFNDNYYDIINGNVVKNITKKYNDAALAFGGNQKTSVYQDLLKQIISSITSIMIDITIQYLKDLLTTTCLDNLLDDTNNEYKNPLNTHNPITGFGGQSDSDQGQIRTDRTDVLEKTFNIQSRGLDLEQQVDLINSLLEDIQCILTPLEIADLLDSVPSLESIALVKSIIAGKYLPDLSYLLEANNIDLLFKELANKLNPNALEQIRDLFDVTENIVETYNFKNKPFSPSLVCSPEQFIEYRKNILENKIPKDIANDVLKRKNKKIISDIKRLIGESQADIPLSVLCPPGTSPENNDLFNKLLDDNQQFVDTSLNKVLVQFNEESGLFPTKYIENKNYYVRDELNGNIVRTVPYTKTFENLILNLAPAHVSYLINKGEVDGEKGYVVDVVKNTLQLSEKYKKIDYNKALDKIRPLSIQNYEIKNDILSLRYFNRLASIDMSTLIDTLLKTNTGQNSSSDKCDPVKAVDLDQELKTLLEQGRIPIYFEWLEAIGGFDKTFEESTMIDFYQIPTEEDSGDSEYKSKIARDLRLQNFFVTFTFDDDFPSDNQYEFKIWYNDRGRKNFKLVEESKEKYFGEGGENSEPIKDIFNRYSKFDEDYGIYKEPRIYKDLLSDNRKVIKSIVSEFNSFLNKNKEQILNAIKLEQLQEILQRINNTSLFDVKAKPNNNTLNIEVTYNNLNDSATTTDKLFNFSYDLPEQVKFENFNFTVLNNILKTDLLIKRNIDIFDLIYTDKQKGINLSLDRPFKSWINYGEIGEDEYIEKLRNGDEDILDVEFETGANDETLAAVLSNTSRYEVAYDISKTQILASNMSLDLTSKSSDIEKACGLLQHYLNLRALKEDAFSDVKDVFCSDGNVGKSFDDALRKIILRLTVRSVVADILMKSFFYLAQLNKKTRKSLYKDKRFVEVIRKLFEIELKVYGRAYHSAIIKDLKTYVFDILTDEQKERNKGFIINNSNNIEVDYSISKEIHYFFKHENYTFKQIEDLIKKNGSLEAKSYLNEKNQKNVTDIFENPAEIMSFLYVLYASQVEPFRRDAYLSTKSSLAKLYSSFFHSEDSEFDELNAVPSNVELTNYIKKIASNPNPANAFNLSPDPNFNKYLNFFLKASFNTTKRLVSTISRKQDPNMLISSTISDSINSAYGFYYSLLTQEEKEKIYCSSDAQSIALKLYERGDTFIPYLLQVVSFASAYWLPFQSLLPIADHGLSIFSTSKNLYDINNEIDQFRTAKLLPIAKKYLPEDKYKKYEIDIDVEELRNDLNGVGIVLDEECDPCGDNIDKNLQEETEAVSIIECTPEKKLNILSREKEKENESN